jgi:hypothetical protein
MPTTVRSTTSSSRARAVESEVERLAAAFPVGRWPAHWIWAAGATGGHQAVAFRRTLVLDEVPATVPARVCAQARYALWVNGVLVSRGPVRANPRRRRFDVVELAPSLRVGENVVGVVAVRYAGAVAWWMPGPAFGNQALAGGFVLEAQAAPARGSVGPLLVSDGEWQARRLEGWDAEAVGGFVVGRGREGIDLRDLPDDWMAAGDGHVHDDGWAPAHVVDAKGFGESGRIEPPTNPLGPYVASRLSPPHAEHVVLVQAGDGAWLADDGRVVVGQVALDLDGPEGTEVIALPVEQTDAGTDTAMERSPGLKVVLDGTRRTVQTFDRHGFRSLRIDPPEGVTVHGVTVQERLHPVAGGSSFRCSDPLLEEVWAVGRRTVSICSHDAYIDCPTREQRAWTGDSVVHQMVDLTTNDDWSLARWHPTLAAGPRPDGMLPMAVAGDAEEVDFAVIPDWALHWVHSVHNLYRYVGDRDEITRLLPVVEGVLRWFEPFIDEHGVLTDVVGWVIIDWASVGTEGSGAALNGLWGRALLELAEMAEWLDDRGRARWAHAAHDRLAAGFERLWDAERERYVDEQVGDEVRPAASQHGQAAAIVGGLAPSSRHARLVELITDDADLVHATWAMPDGPAEPGSNQNPGGAYLPLGQPEPWWDVERQVVRAQPFFRYVVHDALVAAGRADLVASQLRDWRWALDRCRTSWTECWFGGTVSHGWSSTPTRDLVQRVLGVEPAEPGFVTARIEPALGGLEWAAGSVPSPAGCIQVEVRAGELHVTSPVPFVHAGTRHDAGEHRLPLGGST